jgi:hypothetical protein
MLGVGDSLIYPAAGIKDGSAALFFHQIPQEGPRLAIGDPPGQIITHYNVLIGGKTVKKPVKPGPPLHEHISHFHGFRLDRIHNLGLLIKLAYRENLDLDGSLGLLSHDLGKEGRCLNQVVLGGKLKREFSDNLLFCSWSRNERVEN